MEIPEEKSGRDSVLSETISFLRFPLIVLVVFIHVKVGTESVPLENFPVAEFVCQAFVTDGITRVAVPLFFLISGFLFFRNADWSFALYRRKIRSRVSTIVVPFLVWSILAAAYIAGWQIFREPDPRPSSEILLDTFTHIFYDSHGDYICYPLVVPFWFLRDLFVVCLFAPVWHFFLKRKIIGEIFVLALGVLWFVYMGMNLPGLSTTAVFFFCLGAYFSLRGRDFTQDFQKIGIPATIVALPILFVDAITKGEAMNWWIHQSFILAGCVALVFWASRGVASGKLRSSAFLSGSVFMIYAGHDVVFFRSVFHYKLCNTVYIPTSEFGMIAMYFFEGIFSILFWLGVYWCLRRWLPKSLRLLTGGR